MTDEQLERTRAAVEAADHIPAEKKAELVNALSKLKPAIADVSETHADHAQSITRLVETLTEEATRKEQRPDRVEGILGELKQSVEQFETTHPKLTGYIAEFSTLLSNMGL